MSFIENIKKRAKENLQTIIFLEGQEKPKEKFL